MSKGTRSRRTRFHLLPETQKPIPETGISTHGTPPPRRISSLPSKGRKRAEKRCQPSGKGAEVMSDVAEDVCFVEDPLVAFYVGLSRIEEKAGRLGAAGEARRKALVASALYSHRGGLELVSRATTGSPARGGIG